MFPKKKRGKNIKFIIKFTLHVWGDFLEPSGPSVAGKSPHAREFWFKNPGIFLLVELVESWALESGIHLKESRIPLTIAIQNPSFTDEKSGIQFLEPGIRGVESRRFALVSWHYCLGFLTWGEENLLVHDDWQGLKKRPGPLFIS